MLCTCSSWNPAQPLVRRSAVVLSDQPVEDLVSSSWTHRPAQHLPVRVESVARGDIRPAKGSQDGPVKFCVNLTQTGDVLIGPYATNLGRRGRMLVTC